MTSKEDWFQLAENQENSATMTQSTSNHPTPIATRFQEWLNYRKLFWNRIRQILLSIFHLLANDPAKICASPITPSPPKYHHWKLINYSTLQNTAAPLSNHILGDEAFLAKHYSVHTKTTKYPASQTFPTFAQESNWNHSWGKATKRPMVLKRGVWDWHRETASGTTATGQRLGLYWVGYPMSSQTEQIQSTNTY